MAREVERKPPQRSTRPSPPPLRGSGAEAGRRHRGAPGAAAGAEAIVRARLPSRGRRGRDPTASPRLDELEEQADAVADFVEELLAQDGHRRDRRAEPAGRPHVRGHRRGRRGRHGAADRPPRADARRDPGARPGMVVGRQLDERIRVIVDVEDYRKRREDRLEEQAHEVARARRSRRRRGGARADEPLERKLVHDAVAAWTGSRRCRGRGASTGDPPVRSCESRTRSPRPAPTARVAGVRCARDWPGPRALDRAAAVSDVG